MGVWCAVGSNGIVLDNKPRKSETQYTYSSPEFTQFLGACCPAVYSNTCHDDAHLLSVETCVCFVCRRERNVNGNVGLAARKVDERSKKKGGGQGDRMVKGVGGFAVVLTTMHSFTSCMCIDIMASA